MRTSRPTLRSRSVSRFDAVARWTLGSIRTAVPRLKTPSCVPEPVVYMGALVWTQGSAHQRQARVRHVSRDGPRQLFVISVEAGNGRYWQFFTESLILAQDERWRRA